METAKEIADHFINRAKMLNEFLVTTPVPDDFRFNGLVPFDMTIDDGVMCAKVWAVDFNEACLKFDQYLDQCK